MEAVLGIAMWLGLGQTEAAPGREDEASSALRVGIEQSRLLRYGDALGAYERHLRLTIGHPSAHANAAELLMALGRLDEAVGRYEEAIRLAHRLPPGQEREETLALGNYGLGVALDRKGRADAAREAVAMALGHDPRMELLAPGRDELFFIPPGDVDHYRGLALWTSGRLAEARVAFTRLLGQKPQGRYVKRAAQHVVHLDRLLGAAPPAPVAWRVVATATLRADGPLPAPLIDAAWKGQAQGLEECLTGLSAPSGAATVRMALEVQLSALGTVDSVTPLVPDSWKSAVSCLSAQCKAILRVPRPSRPARTLARLEVVLARK